MALKCCILLHLSSPCTARLSVPIVHCSLTWSGLGCAASDISDDAARCAKQQWCKACCLLAAPCLDVLDAVSAFPCLELVRDVAADRRGRRW